MTGVVLDESLYSGENIMADLYCRQLVHVNDALNQKFAGYGNRKPVIFHPGKLNQLSNPRENSY